MGGGIALRRVELQEFLQDLDQALALPDLGGQFFLHVVQQRCLVFKQLTFVHFHAFKEGFAAKHFVADQAGAEQVRLNKPGFQPVRFRRHIDWAAEKDADVFPDFHRAPEVDKFHGAHPVDHDVGRLDVGVQVASLVKHNQSNEDLTQDVERDTGLQHEAPLVETEEGGHEMLPFLVGGLTACNGQMGAAEQVLQVDSVNDGHLQEPDAVGFVVGLAGDEVIAVDGLEFGNLAGEAAHVGPVLFRAGIDAWVMEFHGVPGQATASALPGGKEDDALPSFAEFAVEVERDGIADGAVADDGMVATDEALKIRIVGFGRNGGVENCGLVALVPRGDVWIEQACCHGGT